jgi:hypothetical protein
MVRGRRRLRRRAGRGQCRRNAQGEGVAAGNIVLHSLFFVPGVISPVKRVARQLFGPRSMLTGCQRRSEVFCSTDGLTQLTGHMPCRTSDNS